MDPAESPVQIPFNAVGHRLECLVQILTGVPVGVANVQEIAARQADEEDGGNPCGPAVEFESVGHRGFQVWWLEPSAHMLELLIRGAIGQGFSRLDPTADRQGRAPVFRSSFSLGVESDLLRIGKIRTL